MHLWVNFREGADCPVGIRAARRRAQQEVHLIEEATLRLIGAAMRQYADNSLQPGVLINSWMESLTGGRSAQGEEGSSECLSRRELEVLRLVSAGKSNGEVAAELGIRPNTVKNHLARMYDKANVGNRTELARWALRRGLV